MEESKTNIRIDQSGKDNRQYNIFKIRHAIINEGIDPPDLSKPPSNLPLNKSDHFVGRDTELNQLYQDLAEENIIAICAIAGMGGIGKTELALQYALKYAQSYQGGVAWFQMRGLDLGIQIVNYGRVYLGINFPEELELLQQVGYFWRRWDELFKEVKLIIFDDVEDYEAVKPYYPPNTNYKVLITSRIKSGINIKRLDLKGLSPNSALSLLKSIVGEDRVNDQLQQAENLCQWLGYLPLGLELVGRYLNEHSEVSLKELLRRLEKKKLESAALLKEDQGDMIAQKSVAAAFELSWEDVGKRSIDAQKLSCRLSLFAPVGFNWLWVQEMMLGVDESEIESWHQLREDEKQYQEHLDNIADGLEKDGITREEYEEQLEEWLSQKGDEIEELETLRDSHLIKLSLLEKGNPQEYKLHPLIQVFLQGKAQQLGEIDEVKQAFCRVIIEKIKGLSQTPTQTEILKVSLIIPHLIHLADSLTDFVKQEEMIWVFEGLSRFYQGQNNFKEAEACLKKGIKVLKRSFGESHPDVATSYNNLAGLYESMGRYEEALPYYQQSLAMRIQLLGESHPSVATSYNNLAGLYESMGRYEEALPYYQQSLAMRIQLLGESHPSVATSYNNLAGLYYSMGRYEEALSYYQQSLAMRIQLLGESHPDVATSYNNLAGLYESMGRYEEALSYYQQSLAKRIQLLGESHPDVAASYNNLAGLYESMGRYEEALPYYQQSLAMRIQLLGESHPDVATSYNNLAGLYESMGRYEEALPYYQQSLAMRIQLLGESHPSVATSYNNLAGLYKSMGRYEEALPYYQQSLAMRIQLLGESHPDVATSYNNLAGLYESMGRYEEALPYYQQSLAMRIQLLGESHPSVATSYNNLAGLYKSMGRYEEALPYYQQSLAMRIQLLGESHPSVATSYNNLAGLYYSMGRYEEALSYYQQSLAMRIQLLGESHPDTITTINNYQLMLLTAPEEDILRLFPQDNHAMILQMRQEYQG